MTTPSNLRAELVKAVNQRKAAMRNGRSRRRDIDRVQTAIMRAEVFLAGYPVANDETVRRWCVNNLQHVSIIVPGNNHRQLARLVSDQLAVRCEASTQAA